MIDNIYFDKVSYDGFSSVFLMINSKHDEKQCSIEIYNLDKLIKEIKFSLYIGLNKIDLGSYDNKLAGYITYLKVGKEEYKQAFSIDPNLEIIRYGFLSDFNKFDENDDIKWMRDNHINYVQFYDWSYHHDEMVSPTIEYKDSMGKLNNLEVIKNKIETCNKYGMKTMAYGPVYAATKEYFLSHKEQAYYSYEDKPLTFIDTFYFMNINKKSNWVNHIISQYEESIKQVGFSGIHLDTYGYPKRALDYNNEVNNLEKDLPIFLEEVSTNLNKASLIFNNVGAWPLGKILDCNQSAIYIEVWPPYDSYYHLRELINKSKASGKSVILAAYISSFRLDRERAFYNALLSTFYINSLGATHLFLGEEGCVITQGYYCDYSKLRDYEKDKIKQYQDFFVAVQQIIYDKSLKDVTMTHCGWDNEEYQIEGNYSLTASSNKISVVIKSNGKKHLISLVNLENNDDKWNLGKDEPNNSSTLFIKVGVLGSVKNVYFADPENDNIVKTLEFNMSRSSRSAIIEFEVPSFKVGSLIWFEEDY